MRTGLYKRLSNEELVELYKAGESDAFEALLKNTEGLRATLAQRYLNIPGSEFEDLMSEGAIEMLSAIQNFDSKNYSSSFSTFLYSAISRHYNDMFTAAVCEKRNPGCFVQSYEQVNSNSEYEEDGDSLGSSEFSVECEDYSMVEIRDLLSRLKLSDKERVVVNLDEKDKEKQLQLWERGITDIKQILGIIEEYGDLNARDIKIKRSGAKGSMKTTYQYFPKDKTERELPEKQNLVGSLILDLSPEDQIKAIEGRLEVKKNNNNEGGGSSDGAGDNTRVF